MMTVSTVKDHIGNTFKSFKAMAEHYNIHPTALNRRILNTDYSLEWCLTVPSVAKSSRGNCLGTTYRSMADLAKQRSIPITKLNCLRGMQTSVEDAVRLLEGTEKKISLNEIKKRFPRNDTLGNEFYSFSQMCDNYNKDKRLVRWHMELDVPLSYIFSTELCNKVSRPAQTKSVRTTHRGGKVPCRDHLGNLYSSHKEMADAYRLSHSSVVCRQKKGWTLEEALTTPLRKHPALKA